MKISIVVMAHEKRQKWFPYLRKRLGDVPFSIDTVENSLGIWGNAKRAWLMHEEDANFCLTVQDDAIICRDFMSRVTHFIELHGYGAYQFFLPRDRAWFKVKREHVHQGFYRDVMMSGLATCLPSDLVSDMIVFCDKLKDIRGDDSRIRRFLESRDMLTTYPIPSYVDHRRSPSISGNDGHGIRPGLRFIGESR